jgi:hypothetical protein
LSNLKKYLLNRVRGWFPKDPTIVNGNLHLNRGEQKASKWRHLPLIVLSCGILAALQVILYLLAYINETTLCGGIVVLVLSVPLTYAIYHVQTKYRALKAVQIVNRVAFILGPALLAFPISFFAIVFIFGADSLSTVSSHIGYWPTLILALSVPMVIGGFIGYLIGKKRDFEPYR